MFQKIFLFIIYSFIFFSIFYVSSSINFNEIKDKSSILQETILIIILIITSFNYILILIYNPTSIHKSTESAQTLGFSITPALIFGIIIEYDNLEDSRIFFLSLLSIFFIFMLIISYYEESKEKVFLFGLDKCKLVINIKKHLRKNSISLENTQNKLEFTFCGIIKKFTDVFLKNLLPATVIYILIEALNNDYKDYTVSLINVTVFSILTFIVLIIMKLDEFTINSNKKNCPFLVITTCIIVLILLMFLYSLLDICFYDYVRDIFKDIF